MEGQQEVFQLVQMHSIDVGFSRETLADFVNLVEHCQSMRIQNLRATWGHLVTWSPGHLGSPGGLVKAQGSTLLHSTKVSLFCFNPARSESLGTTADRDYLRVFWDITEDKGGVHHYQ